MQDSYRPVGVTAKRLHRAADPSSPAANPTRQGRRASAAQSRMMRATSWRGSAILDGVALYRPSICRCLHDPPEDRCAQAEKAQRPGVTARRENLWLPPGPSSQDIDIRACLAFAPSHSPHKVRPRFRLVARRPRRRAAGCKRASRARADVPQERSLCEGGADPHETGPVRRMSDPFR